VGASGRETPSYIIRKEMQREKLREKAKKRIWSFEERLKEEGGNSFGAVMFGGDKR